MVENSITNNIKTNDRFIFANTTLVENILFKIIFPIEIPIILPIIIDGIAIIKDSK